MVIASLSLREDYWESFELRQEDIEFIYNYLLETEMPLTSMELVEVMIDERIRMEKLEYERQRSAGGDIYLPKEHYQIEQRLVFPAMGWRHGSVVEIRPGRNPEIGNFEVIRVAFEGGETREYASDLPEHILNEPLQVAEDDKTLDAQAILQDHSDDLVESIEEDLATNPDFVRIAGKWFPRALLEDINVGHLNLAEAVLDMAGGGPLPTASLLEQIELTSNANPNLLEFSIDLALQEDGRFDEVGPAGKVLWFLRRVEPAEVLEPPLTLRYAGIDYDRSLLTEEMLALERDLDDELSPLEARPVQEDEILVRLTYPHWRAGTLPLSASLRNLFPTAYESPRIRFTLVNGDSGDEFPAWVVRQKRYVYGLKELYTQDNLLPGSLIRVKQGEIPGEVIVRTDSRRSSREWIRTVLVGSDGGVVFAMLKQIVSSSFDDRMVIAIPDENAVDRVWERNIKERLSLERSMVSIMRELTKLNPQSHVHATELYAAINVVKRCPPGPLLALLASRPPFAHVGDLHFRLIDAEREV